MGRGIGLSFLAVLVALVAQVLLLVTLARLPEHARLRRLVTSPWRWGVQRKTGIGVVMSGASFVGWWKHGEMWNYDDLHLTSRTLVAALVVTDVVLISLIVGRPVVRRDDRGAIGGPVAALIALVAVSLSLATVRVKPNCDVLHPFDEPPMSVQRPRSPKMVKVAPKAPIRLPVPPPLRPSPAPAPSLGPLRAERVPPLVPADQPEPTSEPIGGCIMHRRPL